MQSNVYSTAYSSKPLAERKGWTRVGAEIIYRNIHMDQSSSGGRRGPSNRNQNRNHRGGNQNRRRSGGGQNRNQNRNRDNRVSSGRSRPKQKDSLGTKILRFFGLGKKTTSRKSTGNRSTGDGRSRRPAEIAEPTSGRLYIGNLDYTVSNSELADFFGKAGKVISADVITNPHNGRSKGFAFVEMGSVEEAKDAVKSLQNKDFKGREILVSGAKSKPARGKEQRPEQKEWSPQGDRPPRRESSRRRSGDRPRNDRGERRGRKRYEDDPPAEQRKPRKVEVVTSAVLQVGNVAGDATEDDLRDVFRDISTIASVKLPEASDSPEKGTARVEFASIEEAQNAVTILHGKSFMGQQITLTSAPAE